MQKSKADLESAEANLTVVKAQVSSDLKSAYAQLLFAQRQAELAQAERALKVAQRHLSRVMGRSEVDRPVVAGLDVAPPAHSAL